MKRQIAVSLSLLLLSTQAHAIKYVIFTDQPDAKKAQEVVEVMKNTYPFSANKVEFEIVKVKTSELDCGSKHTDKSGKTIERLVTCDNADGFNAWASRKGGDQAMIIKDLPYHGGAGSTGGIPVMTSFSSPRVMLHEYLHVLGLCDEYDYPADEADAHCTASNVNTPNTAFFEPLTGYANDAEARRIHSGDIPWYSAILATTPIVNGSQLGTGAASEEKEVPNNSKIPAALAEPVGLYKGKICKNASTKKTSWLPGGKKTVMDDYEAGLGAQMEKTVDKILKSKGAPSREVTIFQPAKVVEIETSRPEPAVDDSPRNFFKDFFQMITDMLQAFGRALTR